MPTFTRIVNKSIGSVDRCKISLIIIFYDQLKGTFITPISLIELVPIVLLSYCVQRSLHFSGCVCCLPKLIVKAIIWVLKANLSHLWYKYFDDTLRYPSGDSFRCLRLVRRCGRFKLYGLVRQLRMKHE